MILPAPVTDISTTTPQVKQIAIYHFQYLRPATN